MQLLGEVDEGLGRRFTVEIEIGEGVGELSEHMVPIAGFRQIYEFAVILLTLSECSLPPLLLQEKSHFKFSL